MAVDLERAGRIFKKLMRIAPDLMNIKEYAKSQVSGYMDLNCDVLVLRRGYRRIALSHYWKHSSGDLISDPDMEISVFLDRQQAEAMTYQDMYSYEVVYTVEGGPPDVGMQAQINEFFEQWLDNLAEQGHVLASGR